VTAYAHQLVFPATQSLEALLALHGATHFFHIIRLLLVHEGKGHSRILIRQGHHGFIYPTPGDQAPEPAAKTIRFLAQVRDDGSRPMNQ
jgi:hypothetical protein